MIVQVVGFIIKTRKLRCFKQCSLGCIGNMDETPLWMDMPGETTVSRAGERTISIRTTGHDKGCFTVILAVMADGKKLKPHVFKGVRPVAELARIPGVVVAYSRNGWMNKELTKDCVSWAWGLLAFNKRTASLFNDCDPFNESDLEEDEEELADNELAVRFPTFSF